MDELEAPDKGRAWLIAFSACIINAILSGLSRVVGLLYVEIITDYGVSRKTATLPFIARNAVRCLSGPLVGVIGQRYGVRAVTFWGGVVASAGAALCYVAPSVAWLTVFWGGMHGLGFALGNTLFQVIVNQYFEKHRATASGISQSGACIGSLVFPFMIEGFLDTYGLSGCFLILAGFVMHVLPPSILLTPPPWVSDPEKYAKRKKLLESSVNRIEIEPNQETTYHFDNDANNQEERNTATHNVNQSTSAEIKENKAHSKDIPEESKTEETNLDAKDVNKSSLPSIIDSIRSIGHLCLNPVYVLTSFSMGIYVLAFIPILTCIVDYSIDKGILESYGKYLIVAMSIGDLLGRLGFGWITDKRIMSLPGFMALAYILQGALVLLFPFANTFYLFLSLLVFYGLISGSILVLFPVIVHKYVEQKSQSLAIGCVGFLSGVISLTIPFLIGLFRDQIGSYDGLFYMIGGISICLGGLWLMEPQIIKLYQEPNLLKERELKEI